MSNVLNTKWICAKCLTQRSTHSRFYAAHSAGKSAIQSRPNAKRLSANVDRQNVKSSRPDYSPSSYKKSFSPRRDTTTNQPKASSGRMTRTGVSVLTDVPLHEKLTGKSHRPEAFEHLLLRSEIAEAVLKGALQKLEYAVPSSIQALAIPAIIRAARKPELGSFLLAAETGSGKTLAYLAPIVQLLKGEEAEGTIERKIGQPRCVILLPSTELVKQVGATVKAMAHKVKLSSSILLPEYDFRRSKNQVLLSPVDILVTMPHRLSTLLEEGLLSLDETRYFVVDEADTLLDISFSDLVRPLIEQAKNARTLVFCSATIPRSVDAYLRNHYTDLQRLVSHKIHTIPRRIATKFIDVAKEFDSNKDKALHQILRDLSLDSSEPGKVKKVILFVNKREKVPEVTEFITSKGFTAYPFSRDMPERSTVIAQFLESGETEEATEGESNMKVLVTTDLASRGIDTTPVKNVIIYDTPDSTIDLLHRIGRTGRAGRRGTAYILLGKKRGEAWVHEVKHLSISGQPLI